MMADDISIKLKLDGERDFNTALKACNAELKNMNSEVKAVEATTKGAANSEEALAKKVEALGKASESAKNKVETMQRIVEKQRAAQEQAAKALEEAKKQYGENSKEVEKAQTAYNNATTSVNKWEAQLNKARTEEANINQELSKNEKYLDEAKTSTDGLATSIDEYGKEVKDADKETGELQKTMAQTGAAEAMNKVCEMLSNTIGKVGEKALDAAKELDRGYDTIAKKTGATGKSLEQLKNVADDVFGDLPEDMDDVATAVGQVNTRFGKTGKSLQDLSTQFVKFSKINETDVNDSVNKTDRILTQFNRSAEDASKLLGMMSKRSQETGRDTSKLMDNLSNNAEVLKMFGFTLEESVNFLSELENNGVEASTALASLKKAAATYTKQGGSMRDGIEATIESIKNAETEQEAWAIAQETFGSKGFTAMAGAIRDGRIDIDNLSDSLESYADVVNSTYESTLSGWDKMTVATNKLKTIGSELTEEYYNAVAPAMDFVGDAAQSLLDTFRSLPDWAQQVIAVIGGIGATAAKMVPNVVNFATQLATLKVMEDLSGQSTGLTRGLNKLKSGFRNIGSGAAAAAATIAGVAAGMAAVSEAAKQLSEDQQRLADKTKGTKEAYDSTKDSIRDLQETIDTYGSTQEKREAIEAKIAEVQEANRQAQRDYADSIMDSDNITKLYNDSMHGELDIFGQLLDGFTNGAVRITGFTQATEALTQANKDSNETVEATNSDLEILNGMLEDVAAEEQAAAASVTNASGEIIAAKDASISKTGEELAAWKNLSSETQTTAQNVAEACGAMKDSITAGVDSVGNFFDAVAEKEQVHAEDMKRNFRSQIEAIKDWEENLQFLADKGINKELLQYMADMGPQAANYVEAMKEDVLNGTESTVTAWNSLYKEKLNLEGAYNEEANKLLTAIGTSAAGSKEAFAAMADDLNAATNANGQYIVAGMVDGINEAMSQAEAAGEELGENTVEAAAKGAETHSPSRATLKTGQNIDQGLINGMQQKKSTVTSKAQEVARAIITAIVAVNLQAKAQTEGAKAGTGLVSGLNSKQSAVQMAATNLAKKIQTAFSGSQSTIYTAGQALGAKAGEGVNAGVTASLSTISSAGSSISSRLAAGINGSAYLAKNAAASLGSSASGAVNVDTSGAWAAGYALAQGMTNGINSGSAMVIAAAAQMAAQALRTAKMALGISSPSKVFEEEVGKNAALGMAKGFNNTIALETNGMINQIGRSLPDVSQLSSAPPNVYVYIGDRELSAVMSSGVVKYISGGQRAYGAAGGRR